MDAVHVGGLGGTYGGNPVAAAAALAVLDLIEKDNLLERSRTLGERVLGRLREMQDRHQSIGDVRGRGMMTAIELVGRSRVEGAAQRSGWERDRHGAASRKAS
jgi:4-aminobutyrate aminotransferase/(S)-3-amino-2-methylpropionate transaminase